MLERQEVGDGSLLLCFYCFDLIYAKHLKLKKRKTRILSFGVRTFFSSVISTTLVIEVAFLMFPPWLVVPACSVSCLEASGNPNDIPRQREHSEVDLHRVRVLLLSKRHSRKKIGLGSCQGVTALKILSCLFISKGL